MKKQYIKPEAITVGFEADTILKDSQQIEQGNSEEQGSESWPNNPDKDNKLWGD